MVTQRMRDPLFVWNYLPPNPMSSIIMWSNVIFMRINFWFQVGFERHLYIDQLLFFLLLIPLSSP